LLGRHQYQNAGLAIAALSAVPKPPPLEAIAAGLREVEWPARLQRLTGNVVSRAPSGAEVWLDGGHNDSAGEALAAQIERWREEDGNAPKPLYVILGMLTTKRPAEFLSPFAKSVVKLRTVPVPRETLSFTPHLLALEAREAGILSAEASESVVEALADLARESSLAPPRILICGSLYLAGTVLAQQED
jgi:dihydrofolate synthase/folylpolyglutamate synthase